MDRTMIMQPLVSVITPSYYSQYLYQAIDSVLVQSYSNIQYIISDDGTDGFSVAEVKRYIQAHSDDNITDLLVLHESVNQGTVKNVNKALSYAKGSYIVLLAGDDVFYDTEVIQKWVNYFQHTEYMFAASYRAVYDEEMNQFCGMLPDTRQVQMIKEYGTVELFESLAYQNYIIGCTIAYTRMFWDHYGGFDEDYRLIDDYPMILRALRDGIPIGFLDEITIKYRKGGISFPENYSPVYKKDTELVYQKEILPYSARPIRHWIALKHWNWNQKNTLRFLKGYEFCKKHWFFWGVLAVLHPIRSIKKMIRMMQGR